MEMISQGLRTRFVVSLAVLFTLLITFFISIVPSAHAQGQAGVSVSPALIDEVVNPGEEKEYSITIKNLNDVEQLFYLSTKDIVDVKDGSTPVFAKSNQEKTGMELASWITLPATEIRLAPGVSERVTFKVKIPQEATCSHFGSIFVSVDPPDIESSGAAIGYQVANIVSLRVSGDCDEEASIRQFSTEKFFHGSKNVDFNVRIENTGNTLVKPTGPLEIYNMLGKKVDTIIFNESQGAVFPKNVREYEFNWTGEGTGFGRYEAILSPVYGENGAKMTMSSTVSFWILPMNIILPALGALAFILLITFLVVRLYIKRTLAHLSQGQTRIVRRRKNKSVSATLLLVVVMLTVSALFMIILLALFA
ncbi:MAG: hypothetical protein RL538_187 [Candidatus Parcubacteria bacterium]|jgi:hypothetical protein